jgi:hypothetical protein
MVSLLARARSLVRRYDRELVCGRCRNVMAWIRLRPMALVRIRDVAGHDVAPWGGAVAVRIAEARLEDARLAEVDGRPAALDEYRGVQASERDLAYVTGEAGEVFYELDCAACHARYLRSLPDLAAAGRGAPAGRVVLV